MCRRVVVPGELCCTFLAWDAAFLQVGHRRDLRTDRQIKRRGGVRRGLAGWASCRATARRVGGFFVSVHRDGTEQSHPRWVLGMLSCRFDADHLCRGHACDSRHTRERELFFCPLISSYEAQLCENTAPTALPRLRAATSFNRPGVFKCPKNVHRQRTGGCGASNLESNKRCSVCEQRLWEAIERNG